MTSSCFSIQRRSPVCSITSTADTSIGLPSRFGPATFRSRGRSVTAPPSTQWILQVHAAVAGRVQSRRQGVTSSISGNPRDDFPSTGSTPSTEVRTLLSIPKLVVQVAQFSVSWCSRFESQILEDQEDIYGDLSRLPGFPFHGMPDLVTRSRMHFSTFRAVIDLSTDFTTEGHVSNFESGKILV